jgi:hypothetical protein
MYLVPKNEIILKMNTVQDGTATKEKLSTDTYTPQICFFFYPQDPNYNILHNI